MRFKDHFSGHAEGYARFRPRYPRQLFSYLEELPRGRCLAWDCATGSGQAAVGLADGFERVVATDASREQIARAAPQPRVEYRVAPAEASGLAPGSVDLVTVAQALHWLELGAFYAEVRRVLAPGGALAVWTYALVRISPEVDRVVDRLYDGEVGAYWPPERRLVEEGYRTLPFPFREVTPPCFEIRAEWSLADLAGYLGTWSAVAAFRRARGEDPVADLLPELADAWGEPGSRRPARWALSMRVGRYGGG